MKKLVVGFVLVFFSSLCFCSTNTAVLKLSDFLQKFSTYQADFEQKTLTESGRQLGVSSGHMMIKRPGMFYWASTEPTQQVMVAAHKILWIYDVDLQQATRQSLSKRVQTDPATLLSGSVKNLESIFSVSMKVEHQITSFTLKPKRIDAGFIKIGLTFKQKKLIAMTILNNLSQLTEFRFTNIKLDQPLPKNTFDFTPPKGVAVIQA